MLKQHFFSRLLVFILSSFLAESYCIAQTPTASLSPEPTNHVTNFSNGGTTPNSITVTWTDATGATLPTGYLIKWSNVSLAAINDPVDGTPEPNGANTINIANGIQMDIIGGLNSSSVYYFKIFPYNNSLGLINYKINGTVPQLSINTQSLNTDYYRSKATGDWNAISTWQSSSDNTNWIDASQSPALSSPGITVLNGHTVSLSSNLTIDDLSINAGGTLSVSAGTTLTLNDGTAANDVIVNGNLKNSGMVTLSAGATVQMNATSVYEHALDGDGGNFTKSAAVSWDPDALFLVTGWVNSTYNGLFSPSVVYGSVRWNSPGQTATSQLNGNLSSVKGSLWISNTGSALNGLRLISGTSILGPFTLTIGKDLVIDGGRLEFSNGSTGTYAIIIGRDYQQTAGTFNPNVTTGSTFTMDFTGTSGHYNQSGGSLVNKVMDWVIDNGADITLNSDLAVALGKSLTVNGIVRTVQQQIIGSGSLQVNGTLNTSHANGFSSTGTAAVAGSVTLDPSSTIEYSATSGIQEITGRNDYGNVTISGGSAKKVNGVAMINNTLLLNNGIIYTDNSNTLTLAETASCPSGNSNAYIDGPLIWQTNTTSPYTFQVGKAGVYNPCSLQPQTNTATTYSAEYVGGSVTAATCSGSSLSAIAGNGYWDIQRLSGTADAQLILNYNKSSTAGQWTNNGASQADPGTSESIVTAHYTGSCWMTEMQNLVNGTSSNGVVTSKALSSFGPFTFGYGNTIALPVHFINLKAEERNNRVIISFTNATEADMVNYEVMRSSDGINFSSIKSLLPAKNDGRSVEYNFIDDQPLNGRSYYRIKGLEETGKATYSAILPITLKSSTSLLSIYPNPVVPGTSALQLTGISKGLYTITIYNQLGELVQQRTYQQVMDGSSVIPLNMEGHPSGSYILLLNGNNHQLKTRFLIP